MTPRIIDVAALDALFAVLSTQRYELVGPTVREGAIVYDRIAGVADLPRGWTDDQEAGHYRLRRTDNVALFDFAVGPHSWKKFLFPPRLRMWTAVTENKGFSFQPADELAPRYAFIGVRACELKAMTIQDRVFLSGAFVDRNYQLRREDAFIIAVNCSKAGATCFCKSMDAGPKVESGFDLALTEMIAEGQHQFLVAAGSDKGNAVLSELDLRVADATEIEAAEEVSARTAASMGRSMRTMGIKELLYSNLEHPRWDDVAARCLSCANCTMVCPTCFCTTVEDTTDLAGHSAERWRQWDSCFTGEFSYIHGGAVRRSTKSRYRQWLTHKLASWVDQFGTSGCVGCGRCITWCPAGIDITEELAAIRSDGRGDSGEGTDG